MADEAYMPFQPGELVPTYSVRLLSGGSLRLGGQEPLTLINVWATWCTPCREEFPQLEKLYRTYHPSGMRLVAVSVDRGNDEKVRRFIKSQAVTFSIGLDDQGAIQQNYRTIAVPETLLIGSDGRLLWRKSGALRDDAADARAAIETALHLSSQRHAEE